MRVGLAVVAVASAVAAQSVQFNVSTVSGSGGSVRRLWKECVGSGHALLSLRADWQAHLADAASQLGFKRVRFHGILDDDMSTYLNGNANMANVFNSFDSMMAMGVEPIVEMSFMPEALAAHRGEATVFHYKGIAELPEDFGKWGSFLDQFFSLMVQRYPQSLKIEAWNEPNCGFLSGAGGSGCCDNSTCGNETAYFSLYKSIAQAVRRSAPGYRIGGPATAMTGWLDDFLTWAVDHGNAPVDYVSTHLYPTDPVVNQSSRTGWTDRIAFAANIAGKRGLNLTVTEFNAGLASGISDTTKASSFLTHVAASSQSLPANVDTLSYWTFTDVFEEGGFASAPFHDGYGLRTTQGVNKPGWCSAQLLAAHGAAGLAVTAAGGVQYSAAAASAGTIDVLASASDSDGRPVITVVNYMPSALPVPASTTVVLRFNGVTTAAPQAVIQTVDENGCNPIAVWQAAGSPVYPSAALIQQMKAAAVPTTATVPCSPVGGSACEVSVTLAPFAMAQVKLNN